MRHPYSEPQWWSAGTESGPQKTRDEIETRNPARGRGWTYAWAIAGGACSKMRALTNDEATQTGCCAGTKQRWKTVAGTATRGAGAGL
jgi:hypothetical protein